MRICEKKDCDNELIRRGNENKANYAKRRFCSSSCANSNNRKKDWDMSEKICARPGCDKVLIQREDERDYHFAQRITCGRSCANGVPHRPKVKGSCDKTNIIDSWLSASI